MRVSKEFFRKGGRLPVFVRYGDSEERHFGSTGWTG